MGWEWHSRRWFASSGFVSAGRGGFLFVSGCQSFPLLPIGSPLHTHTWRGGGQKEVKAPRSCWSHWEFTLEHSYRRWAVEPGLSRFGGNIQHLWLPRVRTQTLFVLNSHLLFQRKCSRLLFGFLSQLRSKSPGGALRSAEDLLASRVLFKDWSSGN